MLFVEWHRLASHSNNVFSLTNSSLSLMFTRLSCLKCLCSTVSAGQPASLSFSLFLCVSACVIACWRLPIFAFGKGALTPLHFSCLSYSYFSFPMLSLFSLSFIPRVHYSVAVEMLSRLPPETSFFFSQPLVMFSCSVFPLWLQRTGVCWHPRILLEFCRYLSCLPFSFLSLWLGWLGLEYPSSPNKNISPLLIRISLLF